eukprot:CAMPEP_0117554026 /NCGR_PEP_ID=MMETSP0784-20121206/50535_1 /TAXON_ID=39447 /ORGANISM="" /LENGTH=93 /DNA_ID=CAMNT_0005351165 /DNA_START=95 /DNA_END=374 /DNA_ORIENTATION=+
MANPAVQKKLQKKIDLASARLGHFWEAYGHTMYHYGLVPGVFAYGLWYSGEFTLNPATLFAKIDFPEAGSNGRASGGARGVGRRQDLVARALL